MANNNYLNSLFRATFQEIVGNVGKTGAEIEFMELYEKYFIKNRDEIDSANSVKFNHLSDSYHNIFAASNEGQIFFQNGRFKNEFVCGGDTDKIGEGGYGEVYRAVHKYDDHTYAVKRQDFLMSDETEKEVQKFLRELKVNAVIKYDFLLQYKSFWFESDRKIAQLYIQMELCAMDLKNVVKMSDKIAPNLMHLFVISNIFQEVLIGVKYLHSYTADGKVGIIHRDLKPANILLTNGENGRFIKIADFGLAVFHDTPQHSNVNQAADYTAPEVKTGTYDTLADIFSLGMVLAKISNFLIKNNKSESDQLYGTKLKNIESLQSTMIEHKANERPTCEQILKDKSWLLTESEVKNINKFRCLIEKCRNVYDINKTFFEYFTYEKLRFSNVSQ